MKTILEHIKTGQLKNYYLIYGEERALMLQYRDRLKNAICPEGDDMNITSFGGKNINLSEVIDLANTLPFFSEHRLIIIEDSRLFASANDLSGHLEEFPDTTYMVFLESDVDKRNKLYKTVSSIGYVSEFTTPSREDLTAKIVRDCQKEGKKITKDAVEYILDNAGSSYGFVCTELEKLLSYMDGKDSITLQDVQEICNYQAEDKIFVMIDAIGNQNLMLAVNLYHDLIYLRKPAIQILSNLTRMVNILLQVSEMQRLQMRSSDMAKKLGLPERVVYKYLGQLKHYDHARLLQMLEACQDTDAGIKSGRYSEMIGVELLIVDFSTN